MKTIFALINKFSGMVHNVLYWTTLWEMMSLNLDLAVHTLIILIVYRLMEASGRFNAAKLWHCGVQLAGEPAKVNINIVVLL